MDFSINSESFSGIGVLNFSIEFPSSSDLFWGVLSRGKFISIKISRISFINRLLKISKLISSSWMKLSTFILQS